MLSSYWQTRPCNVVKRLSFVANNFKGVESKNFTISTKKYGKVAVAHKKDLLGDGKTERINMTKKNMEMEMFEEEYDNAEKCSLSQKSANMPNGEIVSKKNVDGRMK